MEGTDVKQQTSFLLFEGEHRNADIQHETRRGENEDAPDVADIEHKSRFGCANSLMEQRCANNRGDATPGRPELGWVLPPSLAKEKRSELKSGGCTYSEPHSPRSGNCLGCSGWTAGPWPRSDSSGATAGI